MQTETVSQDACASPIRIRPADGWAALNLSEVVAQRDLLFYFVWREIKGRYRQMALGPLWVILVPFIQMIVFSILFNRVFKMPSDGKPYPIFVYTALLPWQYFANTTRKTSTSLVTELKVISKVYFPRLIVPLSATLAGVIDFGLSFLILIAMMVAYGYCPGIEVVMVPFYLLLAMATSLAIGLWLAALAVRFRDVGLAVNFLIQIWFYASPIIYPASQVPERWHWLYYLNPMANVIDGFRWALLDGKQDLHWMGTVSACIVFALLIGGVYVFRRTERTIVDLI